MTLKDKQVLDEDDDVLVNPNMVDDEKFEKVRGKITTSKMKCDYDLYVFSLLNPNFDLQNIESRRLRPEFNGYNVFDEIEFDNDGNLKGSSVLSKYDEEIDGSKPKNTFVIGEDNSEEAKRAKIRQKLLRADKILESADASSFKIASDFYTSEEMTQFKKPKKKVQYISS